MRRVAEEVSVSHCRLDMRQSLLRCSLLWDSIFPILKLSWLGERRQRDLVHQKGGGNRATHWDATSRVQTFHYPRETQDFALCRSGRKPGVAIQETWLSLLIMEIYEREIAFLHKGKGKDWKADLETGDNTHNGEHAGEPMTALGMTSI